MSTSDMKRARVWAEEVGRIEGLMPGPRDAVEVIQSLPDSVVDGDKLREVINKVLANTIHGTVGRQVAEDYAALIGELIPAPPLPTLADMTSEERKRCQWMQAELRINTTRSPMDCVIAVPGRDGDHVRVWHEDGGSMDVPANEVTPRPDLPRLEWPAQEPRNPETPPAETLHNTSSDTPRNSEEIVKVIRHEKELCLDNQDFSRAMLWRNMERAAGQGEWKELLNSIRELKLPKDSDTPRNPRPEDVPAGEPWIVEHDGHEWVGTRESEEETSCPWTLARLDGVDYAMARDGNITLMSRLVPEVKP